MMKLISMNIRGLRGRIKRKYVSDLIKKQQAGFICLQETKCEHINKERCYQIWGSNEIDWIEIGAVNNGGGIITMWKKDCFELKRYRNGNNFLIIEGVWKVGMQIEITIANVYCEGTLREKRAIWDEISEIRKSHPIKMWCVVGDFNSIRSAEERRGQNYNVNYSSEIQSFNKFIEDSSLVDIPLVGRKFTWYKPNGTVKSIIDRILVSLEWLEKWPASKVYAEGRSVSDHCALILKETNIDWGPKPVRCLDVWQKDSRFKELVRNKWESYDIRGNNLYVLKEKLKRLKFDIRNWNKYVFGDVNKQRVELEKRVQDLDGKDDVGDLSVEDREERRQLLAELGQVIVKQEAILHQKARLSWLSQGDLNTKFYHLSIKWRRMQNGINGLKVGDQWCDDPAKVKARVKEFFEDRFSWGEVNWLVWIMCVLRAYLGRIMKCWLDLFLKMKLRRQCGTVTVPKVLGRMVLILDL